MMLDDESDDAVEDALLEDTEASGAAEKRVPKMQYHRNNLTALSQIYNVSYPTHGRQAGPLTRFDRSTL